MNENTQPMKVKPEHVLSVLQRLYPREFQHAISVAGNEMLTARVQELEEHVRQTGGAPAPVGDLDIGVGLEEEKAS